MMIYFVLVLFRNKKDLSMNKNEFLHNIVFGWIKNDLINISKVRTIIPGQDGNANFPLALCVVIYMDLLGGYLLGTDKGGLENNIREYLTCFNNSNDYPPELLNDLFRNGLGHDYFSRGGISRSGTRPPMMYIPKIGVVLDADSFLSDFLESLENFGLKLTEKNFNKRFDEAKQAMEKLYRKHSLVIKKLSQYPSITLQIAGSSSAFASNASGTAIYSENIDNLKDKVVNIKISPET